jgi:hypothetical protein
MLGSTNSSGAVAWAVSRKFLGLYKTPGAPDFPGLPQTSPSSSSNFILFHTSAGYLEEKGTTNHLHHDLPAFHWLLQVPSPCLPLLQPEMIN